MDKGKGKDKEESTTEPTNASEAGASTATATTPTATTPTATTGGDASEAPTTSEGVTTTGGDTSAASTTDPNAVTDSSAPPTTTEGGGKKKKGKKGKKGSKRKGKKGKKGKKKKKKKGGETVKTEPVVTGPQYTQQDIDDYIRKREREKKRRREDRLVSKMKDLVSIVPSDDLRWTTYTLAPLYQFIRKPEIEIITCFFHKEEMKRGKEKKELLFADGGLGEDDELGMMGIDDEGARGRGMKDGVSTTGTTKSAMSVSSNASPSGTEQTAKEIAKKENEERNLRNSRGWKRMSLSRGSDGQSLIVLNDVVPNASVDLFYFVKLKPVALDKDNFFEYVMFGNVPGGHVAALHSLLSYVYAPMFQMPGVLPESIQNEFFGGLTGLMSAMTETHHRMENQTVLYVPAEATRMPIDMASKDKELAGRLENSMIHWIRQIKEVVKTQTFEDFDDWSGPLNEIEFWRARSEDLAGLTAQVQSAPIRTVKEILTITKSPFVASFNAATNEILQAYGEAISNLHYLGILTEPLTQLTNSSVEEIPGQLQNILWLVRVIWLNSPYYNTRERLNSLLRKISNEIVRRCIQEVDIDLVFSGHIDSSEASIKRCMDCVKFWKEKYFEAEKMHHLNSHLTWLLEYDRIFANADGFIKRLQDLQEVCFCQRLYSRRVEGYQEPLPLYPGLKGPEITRIMKEIMRMMDKQLRDLYAAQGSIFDIKSTVWTDALTNFKNSIRDIEILIQNVLNSTFDTVTTLEQGIQIMETFYVYYGRDIIRRTYDQLIMKLFKVVEDDAALVKNLHLSKTLPLPLQYPQYSGRSAWSNFLYNRLHRQAKLLEDAWWLPECGYGEDVKEQLRVVKGQLKEYSKKTYQEWLKVVGNKDHSHRLDIPLMIRSTLTAGMIEVNFDKVLYRHIVEAEMWSRWGQEVPQVLQFVYNQREKLHKLRETVLLVVKDYNRIIGALSFEERSLFKERIKLLGRKVYPGLTKLTWASNVSDSYINDCRLAATKVQGFTANYKNANVKIGKLATKISNILMIKVDQKRLYERHGFNEYQEQHRNKTVLKIAHEYKNITVILRSVFEMFRSDGSEVKVQWIKYLKKIDEVVEDAFCLNIQRSLEILVRVVHGDARGPPPPIFRLIATLDPRKQLNFIPTVPELEDMICGIFRRICTAVQPFPRVVQFLNDPNSRVLSFSQVMAKDQEARDKQDHIANGMKNTLLEVDKYLQSWTQFRDVWETDKEIFMAHYDDNAPSVKAYDNDIGRYWKVADAVQGFESLVSVGIAIIDCRELKDIVIGHCHEWQNRILANLYEKAAEKLHSIYQYMEDNKKPFKKEPTTLPDLINAYNLFRNIQMDAPRLANDFPRLHEQFAILAKYKYELGDHTRRRYSIFQPEWQKYHQSLKDIEYMLKQAKEKLRKLFLAMAENFKQKVWELCNDLAKKGPYTDAVTSTQAIDQLFSLRRRMSQLNKDQTDLLNSLAIFEIEMAASQELRNFEGDLVNIDSVWEVIAEWDAYWMEYKVVPFKSMQTGDMEDVAGIMIKKFIKLQQTFEKKNWAVIESTRGKIEIFKKSIPVIHEIKTPAMRDRHWNQIFETIGARFDPNDPRFTFEKIVSYGMERYADEIADIANTAQKELLIERTVIQIREYWTSEKLEMVLYKDKGHYRLKINHDMMQNLEDNNVSISAMKGSRFAKPFEQEITYWEKTLSIINDVFDIFLTVQRQWMYLENIFMGEDIRKQLPKESKEFDTINQVWKNITEKMHQDEQVILATHRDGLIPVLKELSDRLELILKSLEIFLEAKRQAFPRFYFISNDDLLEILGSSRNPEMVQPHLKKLFDNIHKIKLSKAPYGGRQDVHGMTSGEGEYIDFLKSFAIDGPVEYWLRDVENSMKACLKVQLKKTREDLRRNLNRRDKWIMEWPGQPGITSAQIQWTVAVTRALFAAGDPRITKNPMKKVRKKLNKILTKFSIAIRGTMPKIQRLKVTAMVTVEIHSRDVTDTLYKNGCKDLNGFDWLQQLRFYWDKEENDCIVRQTNTFFNYGYEYLGNSGRLVITPLTDRCYITLTTAMFLHRGGSPKGPAGTGKTETTKDLGKNLGMYVIVVNCSEGLDYKSMGKMFSGLAQTGAWGCFDEFNRINIEVLSVVAQQIMCILQAKSQGLKRFLFEGYDIQLVWSCGIFITMNPGYAGRTELPDNLKAMFRPISMIVPDTSLIAEIVLFGEGFDDTRTLARKVDTLYNLSKQQLSKQDHYDFGLRSMVALLRYAGQKRREANMTDPEVLILAMRDMNIPRLTSDDVPLFSGVIKDLFPNDEPPKFDYGILLTTIQNELIKAGWQATEKAILKCLEVYETKNSRHSTMLVGRTGSGKSVTWKCLRDSMTTLNEMGAPGFVRCKEYVINPKALSQAELYGEFDLGTGEWSDGVISSIMRITCADEKPDQKWILFDGPVDAVWIENMNSVMDDNKILTLINSERISMPEQVSLLFEVDNLTQASPATVSRCGMVYTDFRDLGWKPYIETWLGRQKRTKNKEEYRKNIDFFLDVTLKFKAAVCKELIPSTELNVVTSLTRLMDSLCTKENGVNPKDDNTFDIMVRFYFVFSLIWSVCATTDEEGRKKFDGFLRELDPIFPAKDTIYDFFVDPKQRNFVHWNTLLDSHWKYDPELPFFKITVPTVDTVRYNFVVENLLKNSFPVLIVGKVGTGKTSVIQSVLTALPADKYSVLTINISSQTTSANIQNFIESRLERRAKGVFAPPRGKFLLTFCDDLNMPAKDIYGSQPPLELIRQWCDYRFWYDRQTQTAKFVTNMFLVGAMGPPGGGRTEISPRLQSVFCLINMTFPEESQIKRIFMTMLNQNLHDFDQEVKTIAEAVTLATIDVYNAVSAKMLPTPAKIHYLFNLRDISRVYQGLLRANKKVHDTKINFSKLWFHECCRVFNDRLVDDNDREWFVNCLSEKLGSHLDQTMQSVCPNREMPIFGEFLNHEGIYDDIKDVKAFRKYVEEVALPAYNNSPGCVPMHLVLFREALEHLSRISRVISQPKGSMLIVGIGGHGRQSLSRLASSICGYYVFEIEVNKRYKKADFREDLKKVYRRTGADNKTCCFVMNDTQIVDEAFLEDLNNVLSSGEVPNLYKPDEFEDIKATVMKAALRAGYQETNESIFKFIINRVLNNLHVVLCMSPIGDAFRHRVRQYPSLVNGTTIDWFERWPKEALLEVAHRWLMDVNLDDRSNELQDEMRDKCAVTFATVHFSVTDYCRIMLEEMKRHNYVTPINFLELVSGYKELLAEKRRYFGDSANRLKGGMAKIVETRVKVQDMTLEMESAQRRVLEYQEECDKVLEEITKQKAETDAQAEIVSRRKEQVAIEEKECLKMAEQAYAELADALPALDEANKALLSLNKKDLSEVKSYSQPPLLVAKVMEAVMVLKNVEPTWAEAKKQLGNADFLKELQEFDKDNISQKTLVKLGKYIQYKDFIPDIVGKVSFAAKTLCIWVRAMELYGKIYNAQVAPKKAKLMEAEAILAEKQRILAAQEEKIRLLMEKLAELQKTYAEKMELKEDLERKAEIFRRNLERAAMLVENLAGERVRWEQTIKTLEEKLSYVVGDCLLASATVSYIGPFTSDYRNGMTKSWMYQVRELGIPCDPEYDFCDYLANPTQVRMWNIQGLPRDSFCTENGVIVTRGRRTPLMVDPQCQALKWIKNMESENGLKVIDLRQTDYLIILEQCMAIGMPVLMKDVGQDLDHTLSPVLSRTYMKQGDRFVMKLGDKEIEYNPQFRFYITTKLMNPHYVPEIASRACIVNFMVKEQGLESQLLGIVVRKEKPQLEEMKDSLVVNIAAGKKKLEDLEDLILRLLSESKGSILEDEDLAITLKSSKETSDAVTKQLAVSQTTEIEIDASREQYRSSAVRASILFFVLNDMSKIDPMYQFSLDAYITLFTWSIEHSPKAPTLDQRIEALNEFHTFAVYRNICRGLFEKHKLLFSFHMNAKIMEEAKKLNMEEYQFFLTGGVILDRGEQMDNPCSKWLSDVAWDNITELDKLHHFHGIVMSFEQLTSEWYQWYTHTEPEKSTLPGDWDTKLNEFQKLVLIRSLRPDRVSFKATAFVSNNMGQKFTEPPVLDMGQVLSESSAMTPLIFVLSAGADPASGLFSLAETVKMTNRFFSLSLGQGQAPMATRMIEEGAKNGHWVFLANCHLSLSWMPQLDKLIETTMELGPHKQFRLWLSSSPHPDFPLSILQSGIKMTTEPPKGIKSNMKRLYHNMPETKFYGLAKPDKFKKLLFALCFFHALLLERKKFQQLGWNIIYSFNDSDFEVSEMLLGIYLTEYDETPWDALKYLIAGVMYGGHVTDDWDRRLLMSYINQFFCDDCLNTPFYKLSALSTYFIPKEGDIHYYRDLISKFPSIDHPEAFGQHTNADIASQISEANLLFGTLLSLQVQKQSGDEGGTKPEDKVTALAAEVLAKLPHPIDETETRRLLKDKLHEPLNIVLLQEISRYNVLLKNITKSLIELDKGIQGFVVMSTDLEEIFQCILEARVPRVWLKAYPSLKPLGSWSRDLSQRVDQLNTWATTLKPPVKYWLSGFTFPTGFLTAVLQTSARKYGISIDTLVWDFSVSTVEAANIVLPPKDGVYVQGLYLEGASWDNKAGNLVESAPMQLVNPLPVILFKPVEIKKKPLRIMYDAPCYIYPDRSGGQGRPPYVVTVELKPGAETVDHWIQRGVAVLMSLAT